MGEVTTTSRIITSFKKLSNATGGLPHAVFIACSSATVFDAPEVSATVESVPVVESVPAVVSVVEKSVVLVSTNVVPPPLLVFAQATAVAAVRTSARIRGA